MAKARGRDGQRGVYGLLRTPSSPPSQPACVSLHGRQSPGSGLRGVVSPIRLPAVPVDHLDAARVGFSLAAPTWWKQITSSRSEWCHRDVLFLGPILRFELLNARRQHEPRHLSVSRFTPWSASTTGVGSCWRPSLTDSASRSGGPSGWL